jgi:uncharacterized protein YjbI with pentapeptide repeats
LWAIAVMVTLFTIALLVFQLIQSSPSLWKVGSRETVAILEGRAPTLIGIGVAFTGLIALLAIGGTALGWTGFGEKKLWDWLQLLSALAVPIVLAAAGFWFTMQLDVRQQAIEDQRADRERELEEQRAQDEALQAYLDQMSTLILKDDLRKSGVDSNVRTLAQARTTTLLRRLNSDRKSRLLEFLLDAELIKRTDIEGAVISLRGANLRGIVLAADTDLSYADLSGADLSKADLSATNLSNAYLIDADLSKADLRGATLSRADLGLADLSGANLSNTDLTYALFNDTDLNDATVTGADLWKADMSDAAGVTKDTLVKDAGYVGYTIMPRGKKYFPPPDEAPSEIIKEYPEGRLPSGFWGESLRVGEYETDEFATGFHFELREGWVGNWPEATGTINLCGEEESYDYESFCSKQLNFYSPLHVFDKSNPSDRVETDAPTNGYGWMTWLQNHPDLVTSNSGSVTIGGVPGRKIDVTTTSKKVIPLFPSVQSEFFSKGGFKDRLLIVDVADETVLINIYSPADQFDKWRLKAMETIDTMEWQGV